MIEPPVCVPTAAGTMPAATAAAEPDEDPPGVCAGLRGLRVPAGCRNANSVVTVLPATIAPLARIIATRPPRRGRAVAGIDGRAEFGRHVVRVENVLDADGDAGERAGSFGCCGKCGVAVRHWYGTRRSPRPGRDGVEALRHGLPRRHLAAFDRAQDGQNRLHASPGKLSPGAIAA